MRHEGGGVEGCCGGGKFEGEEIVDNLLGFSFVMGLKSQPTQCHIDMAEADIFNKPRALRFTLKPGLMEAVWNRHAIRYGIDTRLSFLLVNISCRVLCDQPSICP